MREDCRHFQSRTYSTGDTARFCALDLAPEAPWRCPDDCPRFARRMDGGWARGDLTRTAGPAEPEHAGDIGALLDQAEAIVNSAGPGIVHEVQSERRRAQQKSDSQAKWQFWRRWFR